MLKNIQAKSKSLRHTTTVMNPFLFGTAQLPISNCILLKAMYSFGNLSLDKVLSNWVFWVIFTHPFLIEFGIRILPLGTLLG